MRVLKPSEKRSRTPVRPFINEIFSSLVFAVKLLLSRKLSVEMGSEEKNGCEGSADGPGRDVALRVIKDRNKAASSLLSRVLGSMVEANVHCRSLSSLSSPGTGFPAFSRSPPRLPRVLNGGDPLQWTV